MSHELEMRDGQARMFSVGEERPWHGLGKILDKPPTVREAIVAAGLDWSVDRKKLLVEGTNAVAPAYATVRDEDQRILGIVGCDYRPVQNRDAFEWFQPWLDQNLVTLETAGCLKDGRHVWVLARINQDPVEIVKDDAVVRYITLTNSHDGSRMVRAGFTGTRIVCWNTINAALSSSASRLIKVRHTANADDALKSIQESMDLANRRFTATVEKMREMARKGVTQDTLKEYVQRVFKPVVLTNEPADTEVDADKVEREEEKCERLYGMIVPLFEKGRGNDLPAVKGTMWGAYNAITEYLTWERGRNADNRLTSLWFGDGASVAQRAFSVAAQMCA